MSCLLPFVVATKPWVLDKRVHGRPSLTGKARPSHWHTTSQRNGWMESNLLIKSQTPEPWLRSGWNDLEPHALVKGMRRTTACIPAHEKRMNGPISEWEQNNQNEEAAHTRVTNCRVPNQNHHQVSTVQTDAHKNQALAVANSPFQQQPPPHRNKSNQAVREAMIVRRSRHPTYVFVSSHCWLDQYCCSV